MARLRGWNERQKLDELMPRLQGNAGEFVYEMLSAATRSSFPLNSRFRIIESRKTFTAQFNNRAQKQNESAQEYAADLKRLYDKAHAHRSLETRQEDLLRRFLDGLGDEKTRFHVEYIKEPNTIDEAVFEVINFQETRRKPNFKEAQYDYHHRKTNRRIGEESESEESDTPSEEIAIETARIARAQGKRSQAITNKSHASGEGKQEDAKAQSQGADSLEATLKEILQSLEKLTLSVEGLDKRVSKLEAAKPKARSGTYQQKQGSPLAKGIPAHNAPRNGLPPNHFQSDRAFICFKCGREGHFARECPNIPVLTGQMQLAVQHPPPALEQTGNEGSTRMVSPGVIHDATNQMSSQTQPN